MPSKASILIGVVALPKVSHLRDTGESCFFPPLTGNRDAVAFCDISGAIEVVVTCAYLQLLLTHDPARKLLQTSRSL